MSRAALAFGLALLLGGCAAKKVTEIVVLVDSDIPLGTGPLAINRLGLQVHYPGPGKVPGVLDEQEKKVGLEWDLLPTGANPIGLPATIGLLPGRDLAQPILVTVRGLLEQSERVRRQAQLLFAPDRIILLRLNLLRRCVSPVSCAARESCGERGCEPIEQDSRSLPDYSVDQILPRFDGGPRDLRRDVPLDGPRPDTPRPDAPRPGDGPRPDAKALDGPKPDAQKLDGPKLDAQKLDGPKPDLKKLEASPPGVWVVLTPPALANLHGVAGFVAGSTLDVLMVGDGTGSPKQCSVFRYQHPIGTWIDETAATGCSSPLRAVAASAPADVHLVGTAGGAFHFDGKWKARSVSATTTLLGAWAGPGLAVAVGAESNGQASIYHFESGAWLQKVSAPFDASATGLVGVSGSSTELWAVGAFGAVWRYASSAWSGVGGAIPFVANPPPNLLGVWSSGSEVVLVGQAGAIWRKVGAGAWSNESVSGGASDLHGAAGYGGNDRFAVGDAGTVLKLSAGLWIPELPVTAENLRAIWCDGSSFGCCFAVGDKGVVLRRCP